MEYNKYAKIFFLSDLIFCILFAFVFWTEHQHALLLGVILLIAVFTLYPLFHYTRDCTNHKKSYDIMWHINHQYYTILYIISRFIFLIIFIFVSILDKAQIDVIHLAMHLSIVTKISIIIMLILIFIGFYCSRKLYTQHYSATRKDYQSKTTVFSKTLSLRLVPDIDSPIDADITTNIYHSQKDLNEMDSKSLLSTSLFIK